MDRLPPPPPSPIQSAFRTTYLNAFNQIFDNSINVNCICKTTCINTNNLITSNNNKTLINYRNNSNNDDFMDTDEDDDDDEQERINRNHQQTQVKNKNVSNFLDEMEKKLIDLDLIPENDPQISKSQCDCSCFENLRCVYNVLKSCFRNSALNLTECIDNFEQKWSSFKFIASDPTRCCDYYGTTIFHYAASDNSYGLLKCMLEKCSNGITCLDSKGMTPLMRAAQRNNFKCIEYLLNETNSDLNGSSRSTYTPLWFAVSNGYTDLAKLLLDFNTYPSILDKSNNNNNQELIRTGSGGNGASSIYLFSPLRASIVYSKFQIMIYLLQFGANVYELFGSVSINLVNNDQSIINNNNEDYVNSLKFFHRQLFDHENYLAYLNCFIENKNVYRRMMLEFVKNIFYRIKLNYNLMTRLDAYLVNFSSFNNGLTIDFVIDCMNRFEMQQLNVGEKEEEEEECRNYLDIIKQFIGLLDEFINTELIQNETNRRDFNDFFQIVTQKPNYLKSVFEYSVYLCGKYCRPVSLKDLCRFKIRKILYNRINLENLKYRNEFLKSNHLELLLGQCGLPIHLINYLLHK